MALLRLQRGLLSGLAKRLRLSRAAVGQWERVPAELLPKIERITGFPRWMLRPDICLPPPFQLAPNYAPSPNAETEADASTEDAA